MGELKIPGYSTYLHPYDTLQNGIQYLIGLGYSTKTNQRGGTTNDNIKLDLYKIDFTAEETAITKCTSLITKDVNPQETTLCARSSEKCSEAQYLYEDCVSKVNSGNIAVSLLKTHEFEGEVVSSPSLINPRMFVWDTKKKELMMPVFAFDQKEMTQGSEKAQMWKTVEYLAKFVGAKKLSISPTKGFSEVVSQNFPELFTKTQFYGGYQQNARVGYVGNVGYFLMGGFVSFFDGVKKVTLGAL